MGIVVGIVGAVVLAVAALADSLGIGEGHTFGWLQTLGVVLGALILLIGLAIVVGWIPTRRKTVVTSGSRRHDHHDGGRGVAARGGAASPLADDLTLTRLARYPGRESVYPRGDRCWPTAYGSCSSPSWSSRSSRSSS